LNNKTSTANKTTTVGPQMPPFSSSGSDAFTGSCGGVSIGGAGVGVSTFQWLYSFFFDWGTYFFHLFFNGSVT